MIKLSKGSKNYPPNDRTFLKPTKHELCSKSKDGSDSVKLPSPVTDDIVVNNIANAEFDYAHVPGESEDF